MSGGQQLARVERDTRGALIETRSAERVVELVRQDDLPDTHPVQLIETAIDGATVAARPAVDGPAAERLGHLDTEGDGEFPLRDDPSRVGGGGDDAQKTPTRSAGLCVDVVLQSEEHAVLDADRRHLVTRLIAERIVLAQHTVLDVVVLDHPQTRAPRAFDPPVVGLLVGQGIPPRPVPEGGPTHGVVRAGTTQNLFGDGEHPGGPVVGAVAQCNVHPERTVRRAAVQFATEKLLGHEMGVRVDAAAQVAVGPGSGERCADDPEFGVGERQAPTGRGDADADQGARPRRGGDQGDAGRTDQIAGIVGVLTRVGGPDGVAVSSRASRP